MGVYFSRNYVSNRKKTNVKLSVYNMVGQEVAVLVNGNKTAGTYSVNFDAAKLSSGVYFYRIQAGNQVLTKKMMLLK
jgi:hypothetical protein